jgi:hypothetical protein
MSADDRRLLTVTNEGVIKIWDASPGYAAERLRELNDDEANESP